MEPGRDSVVQVFRCNEGLAVRLPESVVKELGLEEGDDVELAVVGPGRLALSRSADVQDVLQRLRAYRGRLPADFKFDRSDANQRQE